MMRRQTYYVHITASISCVIYVGVTGFLMARLPRHGLVIPTSLGVPDSGEVWEHFPSSPLTTTWSAPIISTRCG
jgi:hypothetical protein